MNDRLFGRGHEEDDFVDVGSSPSSSDDELIMTPARSNHDGESLSDSDSSVDDTPEKPKAMKTALGKLPVKLKDSD